MLKDFKRLNKLDAMIFYMYGTFVRFMFHEILVTAKLRKQISRILLFNTS